ncbi:sigma factor-like helix-turn-helix DNA-binding protein [Streptomyces sp. C3-3]|uniref:sigma factor-like helix-turn-helix DNA-binding protein n=1 Tax=Streptomyces sp. C3-3 TaxID=2824901 RepID=UPI0027E5032A|nr:sigma factor-like helix-turn-helix DNA-binding protein [Streptomyces sp. C3-3]
MRRATADLAAEGTSASPARLAEHSGLTEEEVRQGNEALHGFRAMSLIANLPTDGATLCLGAPVGADDDALDLMLDREAARGDISRLAEREMWVHYLRFCAGMPQSAIAAELGISQMHLSRLIAEFYRRIREDAKSRDSRGRPASDRFRGFRARPSR